VRLGSASQSPLGFAVSEIEAYEARLMSARIANPQQPTSWKS
jgi:hypothetical protein